MRASGISLAPWWAERSALLRFVADLVAAELAALRHEPLLLPTGWSASLSLQHDLGADSLELLQLAGSLADTLQMQRSGIEDYLLARRTLGGWLDLATAALQQWDGELTFRTSGSTGTPKRCTHALAALEQEAASLAALFPRRRRLLLAVPSHHIYGFLFGVLLPRHLGLAPEQVVCVRARLPSRVARHTLPGDLVVGHPQFWQAATGSEARFADDVTGASSTAPCPDAVAEQAEAAGLASLVQVYGASETGGLGWRTSHRDAYRLLPYLERVPGADDELRRRGPGGETRILRPQDGLAWCGAERFTVGLRRDAAVQVGGINVFPERAREALLAHPLVEDAAVRLMRPDEGQRLKAFVVPRPGAGAAFAQELRAWLDARLTPLERPKAITLGERLPRGALGKPADWRIDTCS
ncbi:AMP-binding enzyme [Massilia sp. LXY-6]|uniref:AMP-binding enzyme n=1 Tax=Massilia sp. LXY-6 TaxID=3379823 RepID=UPI003EDED157